MHTTAALLSDHLIPRLSPVLRPNLFNPLRFNRYTPKDPIFFHFSSRFGHLHSISCSNSASSDPICTNYGGWDNLLLVDQSNSSGTIDSLRSFLVSLKITDSKQGFVFVLGFLSAFAISKARFSTMAIFPASLVVFVLGFSAGMARSGSLESSSLDFGERLKDLRAFLKDLDAKMLDLRWGLEEGVKSNRLEKRRIRNFVEIVDFVRMRAGYAQVVLEGSVLGTKPTQKLSRKRSDLGAITFDLVQCLGDLFQENFTGLRPITSKDLGSGTDFTAQVNSLVKDSEASEFRTSPIVDEMGMKNSSKRNTDDSYVERAGVPFENAEDNPPEVIKAVPNASVEFMADRKKPLRDYGGRYMSNMLSFDEGFNDLSTNYHIKATQGSLQKVILRHKRGRSLQNETYASQTRKSDVSAESEKSSLVEETLEISGTSYVYSRESNHNYSEDKKESDIDLQENKKGSNIDLEEQSDYIQCGGINIKNEDRFVNRTKDTEQAQMLSTLSVDEEFDDNIKEASELLKKARAYMMRPADEEAADSILFKSANLLAKAVSLKPRSLLAIGQLGNTYLLHGELKLKISRELRALLSRSDELFSSKGRMSQFKQFDAQNLNRDSAASALISVCEECEDLLVEAGRKYRMVLSIDKNDVRALYNWGLALTYRAQLIADIGPEAAFDADKVYMAAIDKFDAIVSKSNTCAPDALFRWGIALQQRSNLQRYHSRDKVKLLQQAKSLFEDVLRVESDNQLVHEALSSCISELKYRGQQY